MGNTSQAPKPQRGFYKTHVEPWRAIWACWAHFSSVSLKQYVEESLLLAIWQRKRGKKYERNPRILESLRLEKTPTIIESNG